MIATAPARRDVSPADRSAVAGAADRSVGARVAIGGWWAGSAVVWLCLWAAGLPAPHVDDLFFTGAGVSLAQGHGLQNPWIEPWLRQFGSADYFAQLPAHPHAVAVWLKCWGTSTASLLALQCTVGSVLCALAALMVKRMAGSNLAAATTWAVSAVFVLQHGLRPEAWGAAFAVAAGWLWLSPQRLPWALGCAAAVLAVLFHPFTAAVAIPSGLASLTQRWASRGIAEAGCCLLIALASAVAGVLLVLLLVDFRFPEFWRAFSAHARMRTPAPGGAFASFWENLTLGREVWLKGPALAAFAAAVAVAWYRGTRHQSRFALGLIAGVTISGILLYAGQTPKWLLPLCGGAALVLWASVKPAAWRRIGIVTTCGTMVWSILPTLLRLSGPGLYDAGRYAVLRHHVDVLKPMPLLVDEAAARYVYDFALPSGARDWLLTRRCDDGMKSSIASKPAGEAWLVDERKLALYVPDSGLKLDRRTWLRIPFRTSTTADPMVRLVP